MFSLNLHTTTKTIFLNYGVMGVIDITITRNVVAIQILILIHLWKGILTA
jgi:hypothetical protein